MRLSDPWEPAPRGQIQPLGAGSQGSDSTLGSRLPGVKFNPWEPAPREQIQPLGAGSQGSDSTPRSRLPGVRFNPWEPALRGQIQPLGAGPGCEPGQENLFGRFRGPA